MDNLDYIAKIIMVFIFLNVLIWGGQEIYHRKDVEKIEGIETYLDNEKKSINDLEQKIELESSSIEEQKRLLNNYKINGQGSVYNANIEGYNKLLQSYKSDLSTYDQKLEAYNSKTKEVNSLIEKTESRWILIPIPSHTSNPRVGL